jgi:hypothetical protein
MAPEHEADALQQWERGASVGGPRSRTQRDWLPSAGARLSGQGHALSFQLRGGGARTTALPGTWAGRGRMLGDLRWPHHCACKRWRTAGQKRSLLPNVKQFLKRWRKRASATRRSGRSSARHLPAGVRAARAPCSWGSVRPRGRGRLEAGLREPRPRGPRLPARPAPAPPPRRPLPARPPSRARATVGRQKGARPRL